MRIALCEDDDVDRAHLESCVRAYCAERCIDPLIDRFSRGEDFLAAGVVYDIVLMDIFMGGINGIEAVREQRESSTSQVVFTTVSRDHAIEAFGMNAAHYLVKPIDQRELDEALDRCFQGIRRECSRVLQVKSGRRAIPVSLECILYIEKLGKTAVVHTKDRDVQTYSTLGAIADQLEGEPFLRAQRSYLVNMAHVQDLLVDRLVLCDGTEIMLSRKHRAKIKDSYQQYLFDRARRGW